MLSYIEWIKRSVGLCLGGSEIDIEKVVEIQLLEQEYLAMTEEERNAIADVMFSQFESNDLIYVYTFFTAYMKNVKSFWRDMLRAAIKGDFNAYIGSQLELNIWIKLEDCSIEKKLFHKQNVERFDRILDINYPYLSVEKRNKKRIVIITESFLDLRHAPTRMICDFVYILQEYLGYEVLLFVCPMDNALSDDIWYGPVGYDRSSEEYKKQKIKFSYKGTKIFGYQINMSEQSAKEYDMMFSIIYAYNPLFVFNCGVINPVADLAGKFTTVVCKEMSSGISMSEANIHIRSNQLSEEIEKEYAALLHKNQTQIFMGRGFPVCFDKEEGYSRQELGLPEGWFLIAIVGNRLDEEIDKEFIHIMKCVLQREPSVAFVVIGEMGSAGIYFRGEEFKDHIYFLGYQSELLKVYGALDLYMNPKRNGGGHSSSMALVEGVPVITLPDCDVAQNVGEEFTVESYDEMLSEVSRYVTDPEYYQSKSAYAEKKMSEHTEEAQAKWLEQAIEESKKIMEKGENNA